MTAILSPGIASSFIRFSIFNFGTVSPKITEGANEFSTAVIFFWIAGSMVWLETVSGNKNRMRNCFIFNGYGLSAKLSELEPLCTDF